jgi:predicted DNA-binding transcriptional regulator AlpA
MKHLATIPDSALRYVRVRRLAAMLDVSTTTVWRWTSAGRLPKPHRLGPSTTAWRLDELEAALARKLT